MRNIACFKKIFSQGCRFSLIFSVDYQRSVGPHLAHKVLYLKGPESRGCFGEFCAAIQLLSHNCDAK